MHFVGMREQSRRRQYQHLTDRWFRLPQPPPNTRNERPVISKLLLLSMFATAARYDRCDEEPQPGTIWEAGLDYMVRAREVLSTYCPGNSSQLRAVDLALSILQIESITTAARPPARR